ncbi:hypothetical protein B6N60_01017 [Richelia sinica FACHB-800]|uniref:Uncharacterized protein n=1 Tax=Richelia sinica FACHB-800 TaxID=1357546 RepID=A0A975Y3P1_9NOST|nr:hypothetical protein [Richelia sinica]MBD2664914.1 hypothetical protein [Richelia sinica FACHB-800]QXE22334.1 hypothetical protein B6N60_01017 [Richelia sinica FACHB-800]
MNKIDIDAMAIENTNQLEESQSNLESLPPLLPRLAWDSQITYLRNIFRAKKALDRIEKEAGIVRIYN